MGAAILWGGAMTDINDTGDEERSGNPRARNTDPEASHEASELNEEERLITQQRFLLAYARAYRRGAGLNSEEAMIEAGYDITMEGRRRRISDLVILKQIELQKTPDGKAVKRYVARTKGNRGVYVITEAGIDRLIAEGLL